MCLKFGFGAQDLVLAFHLTKVTEIRPPRLTASQAFPSSGLMHIPV